jgi:hypothetical protein
LAGLAGLTERTIQRVEDGQPSSLDTRRAIARAFGIKDLDVFEKPMPVQDDAYLAEMQKTTVVVPLVRIENARTLREMIEGTGSCSADEIGENQHAAREAFALLVDNTRDYMDGYADCSMSLRLEMENHFKTILETISASGAAVGAGLRKLQLKFPDDRADEKPWRFTNIYLVLAPANAFPSSVRVQRAGELEW